MQCTQKQPSVLFAPAAQLTKGADGLPVVIGEGAHAVVMLGCLQGMEVAVKVRALWSCWAACIAWRNRRCAAKATRDSKAVDQLFASANAQRGTAERNRLFRSLAAPVCRRLSWQMASPRAACGRR